MSDKLSLNKIIKIVLLSLFLITSCAKELRRVNSEIICSDGSRILVKFVRQKDLEWAIQKAYQDKKRSGTSDSYSALKLKDGRTFVILKIPPEMMISCIVQESFEGFAEGSYLH